MKGTSKVIMGATLVMVVSLAVVLGLILVLLAELYCSLLLRRRRHLRNICSTAIPTAAQTTASRANESPSQTWYRQDQSPPPPFGSIYAQGVLQAPRSFLFPTLAYNEDVAEPKMQHSELPQFLQIQTEESTAHAHHQIGILSAFSPPASFTPKAPPKPTQECAVQGSINGTVPVCTDKSSGGGKHLVYISNPIYENDESKTSSGAGTSFETPDTSPSRLERSGSSGDDNVAPQESHSPPLSPMKKLPAEACSISLSNARSLGTSGSDSHSINGLSSSSSASPCTSPSW